jgi:hypothetical protein
MIPAQNLPEDIPTPLVIIHNENPDFTHHFLSPIMVLSQIMGLFFNMGLSRFEAMFALWGDIDHILCSGFRIRFPGGA